MLICYTNTVVLHIFYSRYGDPPDLQVLQTAFPTRRSSVRRSQPGRRLERGGLAGAVGADQADDLAAFDPEVGGVERDGGLVCLAQVARGDDVFMRGDGVHAASPPKAGFNRSSIDRPRRWMRSSTSGQIGRAHV